MRLARHVARRRKPRRHARRQSLRAAASCHARSPVVAVLRILRGASRSARSARGKSIGAPAPRTLAPDRRFPPVKSRRPRPGEFRPAISRGGFGPAGPPAVRGRSPRKHRSAIRPSAARRLPRLGRMPFAAGRAHPARRRLRAAQGARGASSLVRPAARSWSVSAAAGGACPGLSGNARTRAPCGRHGHATNRRGPRVLAARALGQTTRTAPNRSAAPGYSGAGRPEPREDPCRTV